MTIQIRPAQTTDLPALVGLLDCLFDQESEFKPNPDWERAGLQMIMGNRAIGEIFVADGDGKVIGMVSLLYTVSTALGGKVALLEDVVVDPGHRHSGYGTRLVEHAIKHAKGGKCLRITLLTDSGNQIAQKFYQKFQFERSGMVTMRLLF